MSTSCYHIVVAWTNQVIFSDTPFWPQLYHLVQLIYITIIYYIIESSVAMLPYSVNHHELGTRYNIKIIFYFIFRELLHAQHIHNPFHYMHNPLNINSGLDCEGYNLKSKQACKLVLDCEKWNQKSMQACKLALGFERWKLKSIQASKVVLGCEM